MKLKLSAVTFTAALALAAACAAWASPINLGPPVGSILDINGQPIPGGGNATSTAVYQAGFTATATATTITLAFRDDGAFIDLYDVVLADNNNLSLNLITNPQFTSAHADILTGNPAVPDGWSYDNIYGASFGGEDSACTLGPCWHDGATQAYDAISQSLTTTIGDSYTLAFLLAEDNNTSLSFFGSGLGFTNFSQLSTASDNVTDGGHLGNAIDALAYALPGEDAVPAPVPEPAPWLLLASGMAMLAVFSYQFSVRRR